eukprot:32778-Eustigmatos_ZCMA.PRE.1
MEKAMAEGNAPVALKFMEEKCQVELPEEVTEIEVDPYLWGEALREQHPIRKQNRRSVTTQRRGLQPRLGVSH